MKKILNSLVFNTKISYVFIILTILNFLFCIAYTGKLGTFFVDISREVYIPMAMNDGAVLYKDIFNVYAPLAYQINAFITKIFSDNIVTYYALGYINSTLILWGLYLLARLFFKNEKYNISFYFCLLILSCSIYAISITNYIFPYSYSMVYALNTFIWSLVSILYFAKKMDIKFLYLSFLFFGISISFKYEFLPFIAVLSYFFFKDTTSREKLICFFSFLTVPILSLSILISQGCSFEDISVALNHMIALSKSKGAYNLYSFLGFIPSLDSLKLASINFLSFIILCILLLIPTKLIQKFKNTFVIICGTILEIFIFIVLYGLFINTNSGFFSWIGIFCIFILIFTLVNTLKNKEKNNKLFIILIISTILVSYKCIFFIALNSYGTYYLPLLLICTLIYTLNIKPIIKIDNVLILLFSLTVLFVFSNNIRCKSVHNIGVPFDKGTLYVEDYSVGAVWKTYQYIKNETKEDDTILILPEGAMLNYLTDRKSNNKYYYLLPTNVEIFTEEKIVNDLKNNLPEYIIITPRSFTDYKETFFCESFGKKICKIIPQYYNSPIIQKGSSDYAIAIYKKRYDKI